MSMPTLGPHSHNHNHGASIRIGWAFFLNVGFTIIEFIGGYLTNSSAIMADAVHDLGDSLSIGLAWLLNKLSGKQASEKFSYGFQRFSLLGAFINGTVLIAGSVWVMTEAIPRLANPEMPHAEGMIFLGIFGVIVNGWAAYKLSHGTTLNERILNWHLMEDVLGWVAVLIVAITLLFVDLPILDPILSITFTLFILFNVLKNLSETIKVFLQSTPDQKIRRQIIEQLSALESIHSVHHIHLWSLDGSSHVLTAHLLLDDNVDPNTQTAIKQKIATCLKPYQLSHTTIELEFPSEVCRDGKA